jgi:hypothetical protein
VAMRHLADMGPSRAMTPTVAKVEAHRVLAFPVHRLRAAPSPKGVVCVAPRIAPGRFLRLRLDDHGTPRQDRPR